MLIKEIEKIVEDACKAEPNFFGYGIWSHHIKQVVNNTRELVELTSTDILLKKENLLEIINEIHKKYEIIFKSSNIWSYIFSSRISLYLVSINIFYVLCFI